MKPQEYIAIRNRERQIIRDAEERIEDAVAEAKVCPVPDNLRPVNPSDIKNGAIIWYPQKGFHPKWREVDLPFYRNEDGRESPTPEGEFLYFTTDGINGPRHSIDGAFVEED